MSFFTEIFKNASIEEVSKNIICSLVVGQSVKIIANYKLDNISNDEIVLKINKERIKVFGTNLTVVSMSKGEIDVEGNVDGVLKIW